MPDWKVSFTDGSVRMVRDLPTITAARHTALAIAYGNRQDNPIVKSIELIPPRTST